MCNISVNLLKRPCNIWVSLSVIGELFLLFPRRGWEEGSTVTDTALAICQSVAEWNGQRCHWPASAVSWLAMVSASCDQLWSWTSDTLFCVFFQATVPRRPISPWVWGTLASVTCVLTAAARPEVQPVTINPYRSAAREYLSTFCFLLHEQWSDPSAEYWQCFHNIKKTKARSFS